MYKSTPFAEGNGITNYGNKTSRFIIYKINSKIFSPNISLLPINMVGLPEGLSAESRVYH